MGLSVPQAILIIVVSSILIALFSTIIAWVGLKWHIGFTVQNRYSWGMRGSFIPLLQRILLNFIWNAVQCKQSQHIGEPRIMMLIQVRLEWRPSGCCMLDCDMAFLRTHAEYLQPELPCYDRPVCRIRSVLVLFYTILVAAARKVQDSVPHSLHMVRRWHVGMDDLGSDNCQRRGPSLERGSDNPFRFTLEHVMAHHGWHKPDHRRSCCWYHQRQRLLALCTFKKAIYLRHYR